MEEEKYEERVKVSYEREGEEFQSGDLKLKKITGYKYDIKVHGKPTLIGTIDRDEMDKIYKLYSSQGSDMTRRQVSREFPRWTFNDFSRILRAFNITKASVPFAPHVIEEEDLDHLQQLQLENKESLYMKKYEAGELESIKKKYFELLQKNYDLTEAMNLRESLKIPEGFTLYVDPISSQTKKILNLYVSDLHIGARVTNESLYPNQYNYEEVKRRLNEVLSQIKAIKPNEIIINLMGDNIDGMDGFTARRDHPIPQNMDNKEQANNFISLMSDFVFNLRGIAKNIIIYSIGCGNHDGDFGYVVTNWFLEAIKNKFDDVLVYASPRFLASYKINGQLWVISHGKAEAYQKSNLPLTLDEKTKNFIFDWLDSEKIEFDGQVHVVKGDLHSEAYTSCRRMDYRSVLSLFGDSDYAQYNFPINNHGMSYDLIIGQQILRGQFYV